MLWRMTGAPVASPVYTILDKENCTLEELLDEDEVIQECKAMNNRLINFLRERAQVEQLHYIIEAVPEEADKKRRSFKLPFISCEILTCGVDIILQSLLEDEEEQWRLGQVKEIFFCDSEPGFLSDSMSDPIHGTVAWFDIRRGFGFISPEDGGENLFVHQSSIKALGYRSLSAGESVEFVVSVGEDGRRRAVSVTGPGGAYIKGRRFFGGACYRCGKVGHMAMDCRSNGGRIGPCYSCGMMGHQARECPCSRVDKVRHFELGSSSVSLGDYAKGESVESEDEEEEEVDDENGKFAEGVEWRNWAELPEDVLLVVFRKIAAVEIIRSAQFVCRPWRELSHEPDLWRRILVAIWDENMDMAAMESLAMLAVERSKGCVEEFRLEGFDGESTELLEYISERSFT